MIFIFQMIAKSHSHSIFVIIDVYNYDMQLILYKSVHILSVIVSYHKSEPFSCVL